MKHMVLFVLFVMASTTMQAKSNLSENEERAVALLQPNAKYFAAMAAEHGLDQKKILAIPYGENVKFSHASNFVETLLNEIGYRQKGSFWFNFSIGQCQQTIGWQESLIQTVASDSLLACEYPEIASIQTLDIDAYREAVLARLKDPLLQYENVCAWYELMQKKFSCITFSTDAEEVDLFATAYAFGDHLPVDTLIKRSQVRYFPYGPQGSKVTYGSFAQKFLGKPSRLVYNRHRSTTPSPAKAHYRMGISSCIVSAKGDAVVPYSYEAFVLQNTIMYEQAVNHLYWTETGAPVPYFGWTDLPEHHYILGSTFVNLNSFIQGCNGIIDTLLASPHLQAGCTMPRVVIWTAPWQDWGDFQCRPMWNTSDGYIISVNGVQQPATVAGSISYITLYIESQTLIEIKDPNGCTTALTLYPKVGAYLDQEAIGCDSVKLTVHTYASNPGPLSYQWSNGQSSQSVTVPAFSWNQVLVKNVNGYSDLVEDRGNHYVQSPRVYIELEDDDCEAYAEAYSGQEPYTFEWSNGSDDDNITVSSQTEYSVTVTDGCGHTDVDYFYVPDISHTTTTPRSYIRIDHAVHISSHIVENSDTFGTVIIYVRDSVVTKLDTFKKVQVNDTIITRFDCSTVIASDTVGSVTVLETMISDSFATYRVLDTVYFLSTGIEDVAHVSVMIYPNPSNGRAYLLCDQQGLWNGTIRTVSGNEIDSFVVNGKQRQLIDLRDKPNGVYFITIVDQKSGTQKHVRLVKNQ